MNCIFGASWMFVVRARVCVVVCNRVVAFAVHSHFFSTRSLVRVTYYYFARAFYYTDLLLVQNDSCEGQSCLMYVVLLSISYRLTRL